MKIIGITGPSGSGKSLFSRRLSEGGICVIDADEVYHDLLVPPSDCLDALRKAFGDSVFESDGTLNRKALADIVFHDKKRLELLNSTVLGFVLDKIRAMISELDSSGHTLVAVDAPTLIESGFHKECDTVISVLCPAEMRIERIMKRDGLELQAARARTLSQKPDEFYREHSDWVIINDGNVKELENSILKLIENIK